jgi:cell division protein FtsW
MVVDLRERLSGRVTTPGDRWLLLVTLLLTGAGLAMVLSSSQALAYVEEHFALYYFVRQAFFAGVGVGALWVLSRIDYHRYERWALPGAAAVAVLMLATRLPGIGVEINGARRWLDLGPLGTLQPSELAKLAFTIFMAVWISRRQERIQSFREGFLPFCAILAAAMGLLLIQKDLGTSVVMCAILLSVFFAGGGRLSHLLLLGVVLGAVFAILILAVSYRSSRLGAYFDPFAHPQGTGFQISQALIGIGSGGLTGVGLGHSVEKYFWLPEADTDFIFAIIGEETGLVGTTLVLLGFVVLAVRGYRAAIRAPDPTGTMIAAGITTWVSVQALVNMASVTDTVPAVGVPLPFISYGGSALAITLAAMGVLLNVAAQGGDATPPRRRRDETADLGRRDWRAPVAGARRRPGVPR